MSVSCLPTLPTAALSHKAGGCSKYQSPSKYHLPSFYDTVIKNKSLGTVFDCHKRIATHFDRNIRSSTGDEEREVVEQDKLRYFIDTSVLVYKYHDTPSGEKGSGLEQKKGCVKKQAKRGSDADQRDDVIHKYREYVDPVEHTWIPKVDSNPLEKCRSCGSKTGLVIDETTSALICNECGMETHMPLLQSRPSYKMTRTRRPTQTQYKRENHFNDWLTQIQAKESITVPEKVYDKLNEELAKRRHKCFTPQTIRSLMRKLGLNKYYEHIPRIIHRLHGTKPPNIDQQTEERLRIMFKMIQDPFDRHSPNRRKNFLSYAFVLRKFVGLLGLHELQASFPLLKSRAKLYQQDQVWCKICKDLNWHYEPSL